MNGGNVGIWTAFFGASAELRAMGVGEDWKEAREKARGHADTDRVLGEAHKLFEEVGDMLTEMRRQLLGRGRQ
jgi:hypothetical protein